MLPHFFYIARSLLAACLLASVTQSIAIQTAVAQCGCGGCDPTYSPAYQADAPVYGDAIAASALSGPVLNSTPCWSEACRPIAGLQAAPKPCLETNPGSSTYWHDPTRAGYRHQEPLCHNSRQARFFASIESVALFRSEDNATNVLPLLSAGPLNNEEFETEFAHTARGVVGLALGDWYRMEFAWLNDSEWSDRVSASVGEQPESAEFQSTFKSGEINLRRRVRIGDWPAHYPDYWNSFELSTLVGYRYVDLSEELSFDSNISRAQNDLSGFQVGLLSQWLYEDRGWLDLEIKGAILSNDLSVMTASPVFRDSESRTAFLIDASLVCNYQFSQALTLRLGYNFYWLSGVALASENTFASSATPSSAQHDGELLLHGPSIGLVFAR